MIKTNTQLEVIAPKESAVIEACRQAVNAQQNYALKALIAGQMLAEHRAAMMTSHDGKSWNDRTKEEADQFGKWLKKNNLASTTAYRWMEVAERVAKLQLGLSVHELLPPAIEVEGVVVTYSDALTLPEKQLSAAALKFRQGIFDFMADKTLTEALTASVDGESEPKRITLAAGGKSKGGTRGEDRKAFDKFTANKLKHLTTFFGHKLNSNQKGLIIAAFNCALELWPRWLIEAIAEKCRTELKMSEHDRTHRKDF